MTDPVTHHGGCHCGRVRFEVRAPARPAVVQCNCSMCRKSGHLHLIVTGADFRLLSGQDALTSYRFNTGTANHLFCSVCGVKSFYVPRSHPDGFSVNARCLDDGTLEGLDIRPFDGRHWEQSIEGLRSHSDRALEPRRASMLQSRDAPKERSPMSRILAAALAALVLGTSAAGAAAPAAAPRATAPAAPVPAAAAAPVKVTEAEGITEYRLANGLRVLLYPDPSKPTITVNITYLVGSRHENYGETGMAHLLEHMLFKGTPRHPDIPKEFNARGMRINGTTSLDRTNYFEMFQASEANLDWALGLEADRMVNSFVSRKDLDSEMTVVRNEYERGENAPTSVLFKRLQSVAYDWHNYGNSTIGNRSDIENVGIPNLQAFYRRYYQPDNAVLLVAGQFDPARTLRVIQREFGAIPKPTRQLPKLWTVEPVQDGERTVTVRRVGDLQVVALAYKVPSPLNADEAALTYAGEILSDAPSGRLHKALVETGKAAQVASTELAGVDGSLQVMLAFVKKGDPVEPVEAEMTRIVESFHEQPPTAEEMQRLRLRFATDTERTLNDPERVGLQLSEFIALGDWRLFFLNRDRLDHMTPEQVQAAAGRYYRRDNRTVGLFLHDTSPQRAEMPAVVSAAEALKDYKPRPATALAEAFDPSPDNIDRRTKHVEIDGMKIALLHKKTRGETVNVSLRLPSGDEKTLFGTGPAEQFAGPMLMRGTTRYDRQQLQDEFTKLKVQGGVAGRGGRFETTKANLPAALRLAAHVLREPSFPASEFEQLKRLYITSIEAQMSEPQAVASSALEQHFNIYPKGDVRYSPTLQEQLEEIRKVSLDEVKAFHQRFFGANHLEIAVVGDFEEDEVLKAIREGFAGWKAAEWTRVTSRYAPIPPARESLQTPDKENAVFIARQNLDLNEEDEDYPALYLVNYMLGGGAGMDARLMARIRVKEGLSYGVGSGLSAGRFDRAGSWTMQAICAPQNADKVEAAFKEELARLLKDGFTAEEIAKAKSGFQQKATQSRTQDSQLASELVADIDSNRSFAWDKAFEAKVAAVTPEQLLAAARKHLDPAKMTIVRAGDFKRAAAAKPAG